MTNMVAAYLFDSCGRVDAMPSTLRPIHHSLITIALVTPILTIRPNTQVIKVQSCTFFVDSEALGLDKRAIAAAPAPEYHCKNRGRQTIAVQLASTKNVKDSLHRTEEAWVRNEWGRKYQ